MQHGIQPSRPSIRMILAVIAATNSSTVFAGDECLPQWDNTIGQPGIGHSSSEFDAIVRSLISFNGEVIAGGLSNGGTLADGIARWNGSTWQPLPSEINGEVRALSIYNGELIAGGEFLAAAGITANRIARWNGESWQPLGNGVSNRVFALAGHEDELIVGGQFTTAGLLPSNRVATWNACPNGPVLSADLNGDGIVDGVDLGILLANWSMPPGSPGCGGFSPCLADLNGDTFVDGFDLGILLASWTG